MKINELVVEEKVRLDPKCWTGKKIGNPKTKMKGGVRVNNCVPAESVEEAANAAQQAAIAVNMKKAGKKPKNVNETAPHPQELEMDAKVRSMQIQNRADDAEQRLAARANQPKNLVQKIKKDIGGPIAKLVKGDIKGALGENDQFNPEYDDEAGMADNNLETLERAVDGIDDLIQAGDNLPEWCQE